MSKTKFTPGPWKIVEDRVPSSLEVYGGTIAICECWRRANAETEMANAHLIAAAPDMFEELKSAAEIFAFYAAHHLAKGDKVKYETNISHAERISKILVKARGEG